MVIVYVSSYDPSYIPNCGNCRDPRIASRFVQNATLSGSGPGRSWELAVRVQDAKTGRPLAYNFTVAANGTALAMWNASAGGGVVTPLRQWLCVVPFA